LGSQVQHVRRRVLLCFWNFGDVRSMQSIDLVLVRVVSVMKISDAALRLAATEQERRGWIRHLKRMDDEYREERGLLRSDVIIVSQRQIFYRQEREI